MSFIYGKENNPKNISLCSGCAQNVELHLISKSLDSGKRSPRDVTAKETNL